MSLFNTSGSPSAFGNFNGGYPYGGGSPVGGARGLFWRLPEEEGRRLATMYDRCRNARGFVQADIAKVELERAGLASDTLQSIWEMSDLDRDGRLSLREFACAMHLAEQARVGHPLPHVVTVEQQSELMRSVEAFVPHHTNAHGPKGVREAAHGNGGDAFSTVRGAADLSGHRDDGHGYREHLGQLAAMLEAARERGNLHTLCKDVIRVREELEEQVARRRDYQQELREVRSAFDTLRDEWRVVAVDTAAVRRRVAHLQDEVAFVESELQGAEGDLVDFRDAAGSHGDHGGILDARLQLEDDLASIRDLKERLVEHSREKAQLQAAQQALVERQRHIDHDRGLTLTAIEAERHKLAVAQQMRLKMAEERAALEHEMAQHGEVFAPESPPAAAFATTATARPRPPPTSAAGARRADHRGVPHDEPSAVLAS